MKVGPANLPFGPGQCIGIATTTIAGDSARDGIDGFPSFAPNDEYGRTFPACYQGFSASDPNHCGG